VQAGVESKAASTDGCAIAFRSDGAEGAPALLLSNALGLDVEMWTPQMPSLASHFRVIRYDTRGHGRSDVPRNEYTVEQLGRDAVAVLDAAGVARAHVCGLSLGGITAMWMGVNAPSRVQSLVLAATAARIGSVDAWNTRINHVRTGGTESIADAVIARWFTDEFRQTQPSVVASYRRMLTSTPRDGYIGCCAALRSGDLRDVIQRIALPTLVVAGAVDPATPPADGDAIRRSVPGATMVTLSASHLVNVEQAEAFNQAVLDFSSQQQEVRQING
jgi:3-oxoadipate enol-lactonase